MNRVAKAMYEEAICLVSRHQIATCSFLQRQLRISYTDANSILAQLRASNRLPSINPVLNVANVARKWLGEQTSAPGACCNVTAGFFDVDSGISFSSIDLYCALLGSQDADDLSVACAMARATGARRAYAVVMTILDSIGEDTHAWPADGLVLKITSDPARLLGHEVRQICSALRGHAAQHCVTALAIHYAALGDDLVLEVIASKIDLK